VTRERARHHHPFVTVRVSATDAAGNTKRAQMQREVK
jgi:hypothetical protein